MNDDDVMAAVRDRFAQVRMNTPAKEIMARGAGLRRRRNGGRLAAGALALSLGAGLSVPALTAGTTTAAARQVTLTAWTVQKHSDGSIGVTIRRPQNLSALQERLAKLGAPVIIVAGQALPAHACAVAPRSKLSALKFRPFPHAVFFKLEPAKIPPHALLWIGATPANAKKFPHLKAMPLALQVPVKLFVICGERFPAGVLVPGKAIGS